MIGVKTTAACVAAIVFSVGTRSAGLAEDYNPKIDPADFTTNITNPYFSLPVGKKIVFESRKGNGVEKTEIQITGEKRQVMGIETLVYWDRVWLNDNLIEDTRDYLAQDKDGNVWYFGEDVKNYVGGKLSNRAGSWLAGADGAKPGIWFKANPRVGDKYRQEYYRGKAEDMAEVVAVGETVTIKRGTYKNCVKTYDWTPLEPNAKEHKYYCPEVGGLALIVDLQSGARTELVEVGNNAVKSGHAAGMSKVLGAERPEGLGAGKAGKRDGKTDDEDEDER
ncbi:MAG: hypothetical protein ACREC6_13670 [Hyphomicrobiaceae bacterium]